MRSLRCPCGETVPLREGEAFGKCPGCGVLLMPTAAAPERPGLVESLVGFLVICCLALACFVALHRWFPLF